MRKLLEKLRKQGCFPGVYARGDLWRAHVNQSGNYWADAVNPALALSLAVELWEEAGKPMDGQAASTRT